MQKPLKFAVNRIVLDGYSTISPDNFAMIKSEEIDPLSINKGSPDEETLSVNQVEKYVFRDRFVALYFLKGDKYPYPQKVVDEKLKEKDNPRSPDLIELSDQLFVLVDTKTQRIYVSDQRRRSSVYEWLKSKLPVELVIKAIIDQSDFLRKIKRINKISFNIVPNLFNHAEDSLFRYLVDDIYGYGAESARLELNFNNTRLSDKISEKINEVFDRKVEYKEITVIGRGDGEMESILNLEEITNSINVDVVLDQTTQFLNPKTVFASLISKIDK